jgi:DNA-binding transcriptional regulator YhcF (GntR family)
MNFTKFENELIVEINQNLGIGCGMMYMILLMHKNKKEGMADSCFPSYTILSKETGCAKNTIGKYIRQLEEAGYIIIKSGKFNNESMQNESNKYYFPKSDISVTCYSEAEYNDLFKDLISVKRELCECPFTSDDPF